MCRTELSSVKAINFVKKIYYSSRDIEFFLGDYFLAHPVVYNVSCADLLKLGQFQHSIQR